MTFAYSSIILQIRRCRSAIPTCPNLSTLPGVDEHSFHFRFIDYFSLQ